MKDNYIANGNIKWKIVRQFFKKLNIELLYIPWIPLLGIYFNSKGIENIGPLKNVYF